MLILGNGNIAERRFADVLPFADACRQQQNATHRLVPSVSVSIVSVQVGLVQRKCREANLAHIILHPIREVMLVQYRAARHFL